MKEKRVFLRETKDRKVIFADVEQCTGCQVCMLACSTYNEGKSSLHLSRIKVYTDFTSYRFRINYCIQCEFPVCLHHCPVGAIMIDEKGVVFIDENLCTGCGMCAKVCPFNAVTMVTIDGSDKAVKCDLCRSREEGPICVEMCPTGALRLISWRPDLFGGWKYVWMERRNTSCGFDEREDLEGKDRQGC